MGNKFDNNNNSKKIQCPLKRARIGHEKNVRFIKWEMIIII